MRKRPPTHPGAILREDVLPSLAGHSVTSFARALGISRQTLHAVLAERSGVSAEMALRLGTLPYSCCFRLVRLVGAGHLAQRKLDPSLR